MGISTNHHDRKAMANVVSTRAPSRGMPVSPVRARVRTNTIGQCQR